jgi:Na+-transporting methylmalonyl-CoA/oxaloacetate decarboxylase gamma subunit
MPDRIEVPLSTAFFLSLLGMGIVFAVLILLMICIKIISAASMRGQSLPSPVAPLEATLAISAAQPAPAAGRVPAPGSLGEVALHTVDDKTAALLMCIVADQLKSPLNELRFLSIREI